MKPAFVTVALAALLGGSGCILTFGDLSPDRDEPEFTEDERRRDRPPVLSPVTVPDWPPMGPNDSIEVSVTDDHALERVSFEFASNYSFQLEGTAATVVVTGADLGDGYGTLGITAEDDAGQIDGASVRNFLVDLTPPELAVHTTAVPHRTGQIELVVSDAWLLGAVEVEFQGRRFFRDFPDEFPATFGQQWDQSVVTIPAATLPAGRAVANIVVTDAAGNETRRAVDFVLDALPPTVELVFDSDGPRDETFEVRIWASDDLSAQTSKTLYLSGTPVGTTTSEDGVIMLDPHDFWAGEHELTASAVDSAGNRGWSSPVTVTID